MLPGYSAEDVFKPARGLRDAMAKRRFETRDIVRRLGVINREQVVINGYPIHHPVTVFNSSVTVERGGEEEYVVLYARIIAGYYMYISSIIEVPILLEDVYNGDINLNIYTGRIVVYPSTRYDLWGAEDPRVYRLEGSNTLYMTYTGRTVHYFRPGNERTLPVTAVKVEEGGTSKWRKIHAYTLHGDLQHKLISNKNAFLYKHDNLLYLFHRPHLLEDKFYLLVSELPASILEEKSEDKCPERIEVDNGYEVLRPAEFEVKLGWATPPIRVNKDTVVALIHGVDRELQAYRVLGVELGLGKDGVIVKAVTPHYIMEPQRLWEVFGDRPYVVFPCGIWRLEDRDYIISYGAADTFVGLGLLNLDELLGELDKGRIYE
jgi:predicted GH43/DUF377 family glycosyl hydrolase